MSKPAAKQRHDVAPMRKHGGTEKNEMDFALRQHWAVATTWLAFQCRNVNIHTIRKHAFVHDFRGKTNIQ